MFIINGCLNTLSETDEIESRLLEILDRDVALGVEGFDSGGDMELDYSIGLGTDGIARTSSDTLSFGEEYRIRFGRQLISKERTVEFEIGEVASIAMVTYTANGEFIVIAIDTSQNQIDSLSFSKEFNSILNRKVRFVKVDTLPSTEVSNWKVDALTPLVGWVGDKISLAEISFFSLSDSLEVVELLYSFSSDELGNLYINRDSLPVFTSFSRVISYINVINNAPEYSTESTNVGEWVFLNYGKNRLQRGRRHLKDSGMFFDQILNDNIHSGIVTVHGPGPSQIRGLFRKFIELIDLSKLLVSNGGYNMNIWPIPYKVERPYI